MGNYLKPISDWAQKVLEEREKNPMMGLYRTPFVVMYSGAAVVKGSPSGLNEKDYIKRKNEIDNLLTNGNAIYNGCIISNNINNLELSYSTNQTPVGVTFDGKVILVEGESGRKVSTPIITSVDVDTEEFHNAIKTTKIGVKCFTLKQLEMFELFFMKPGMSVMVEWGDSSLLKRQIFNKNSAYTDISDALFINRINHNFDAFCDSFSSVFVPNDEELKTILKNIEKSLGSYDYTAGKVSDYTYSISEDGTYDITITLFQANQISLAIPTNYSPKSGKNKTSKNNKSGTQPATKDDIIHELIIADFELPGETPDIKKELAKYNNHFFNFNTKNTTTTKTTVSKDAYISLHFILKYLANIGIPKGDKDYEFRLPTYGGIEIVPAHSSPFLISSTKDIIFPNKQFPQAIIDNKQTKDDKYDDEIVLTQYIDIKDTNLKKLDGTINTLVYNLTGTFNRDNDSDIKIDTKTPTGNALNIFISYKKVFEIYKKSYSKIEFIKDILNVINSNSYGLIGLTIQPDNSVSTISTKPTIVDSRFTNSIPAESYRFKPTTINSCVREFTYNFQMDNLIAGYIFFNSAATLRQAFAKAAGDNPANVQGITIPPTNYKAFDYGAYANADGYYSINNVEKKAQQKYWEKYKQLNKRAPNVQTTIGLQKETTKDPAPDLNNILTANKVLFDLNKKEVPLIYLDKKVVQAKIRAEDELKSILTNITVSITIDGFSGLRAGEVFQIDGIPEIYNQIGVFQITNIKQNITPEDGWKTIIEATWRIGMKN